MLPIKSSGDSEGAPRKMSVFSGWGRFGVAGMGDPDGNSGVPVDAVDMVVGEDRELPD